MLRFEKSSVNNARTSSATAIATIEYTMNRFAFSGVPAGISPDIPQRVVERSVSQHRYGRAQVGPTFLDVTQVFPGEFIAVPLFLEHFEPTPGMQLCFAHATT
jgi:hypothetical protein